jgi:hypothetical protein
MFSKARIIGWALLKKCSRAFLAFIGPIVKGRGAVCKVLNAEDMIRI